MRFCVIGLGYVGTVTAACFATLGHDVLAWDTNPERNESLREGRCPVPEPGLEELLVKALTSGTLHIPESACFPEHDLFFICVGTPLQDGHLNHDHVAQVLTEIYSLSSRQELMQLAIIRSTINMQFVEQLARDLGREYPRAQVEIVLNPEFLREGSAVADFLDPPFVVVGGAGEPLETVLAAFSGIRCRKFKVSARSAAMLKLACNAFHATKVAFTNDVAMVCDLVGADAGEVFAVFREDRALNCSARYLRPGFAFGGSCLPKDLRELVGILEANGRNSPLLSGVLPSPSALGENSAA